MIARQLRKQFDQRLDQLGVTRSQWTVIAVVARQPGISQRAIAELLEVSEAGAGRLIDRLCADGLLARHAREDDRRSYRIELTEAARPLLERVGEVARVHESLVFGGIDQADLARLGTLLDDVYGNINP